MIITASHNGSGHWVQGDTVTITLNEDCGRYTRKFNFEPRKPVTGEQAVSLCALGSAIAWEFGYKQVAVTLCPEDVQTEIAHNRTDFWVEMK